MKIRNRFDKNNIPLPADYQVEELPEDLYDLLSEVYARRLQKLENGEISTSGKSAYGVEISKAM